MEEVKQGRGLGIKERPASYKSGRGGDAYEFHTGAEESKLSVAAPEDVRGGGGGVVLLGFAKHSSCNRYI